MKPWKDFQPGVWQKEINVRNFIQKNYTLYTGDDSFLQPPTEKTKKVWGRCEELLRQEMANGGVLDVETHIVSGINNFAPGYIDRENEVIVGLQTDAPLKRIVNLYGGMRMAKSCSGAIRLCSWIPPSKHIFPNTAKHTTRACLMPIPQRTRVARHAGLLTGLPDAYGRGRIIGDYRRVALYGIDALVEEKQKTTWTALDGPMTESRIRMREEVSEADPRSGQNQGRWLLDYGIDISRPRSRRTKEAVQCLVFRPIWPASRKTTAPPRLWAAPPPFWISTLQRDLQSRRCHRGRSIRS